MREFVGYLEHRDCNSLALFTENVGKGGYTVFGEIVGLQGFPWCAVFVFAMAKLEFGQRAMRSVLGKPHPGCIVLARRMRRKKLWRGPDYTPQAWDVVFCTKDGKHISHCGVVESADKHFITSIDGNTVDSSGAFAEEDGGAVAVRVREKSSPVIVGYAATGHLLYQDRK